MQVALALVMGQYHKPKASSSNSVLAGLKCY